MRLIVLSLVAAVVLVACEKNEDAPPAPRSETATPPATTPETTGQGEDLAGQARGAVEDAKKQVQDAAGEVKEQATKAAAEVSAEARATMEGYLSKVQELTGSLSGLKGGFGDLASAGDVKSLIEDVTGRAESLLGLEPGTLDALKQQYGPQLAQATDALKAQIKRIGQMPQLAKVKGWLEKLPLVE